MEAGAKPKGGRGLWGLAPKSGLLTPSVPRKFYLPPPAARPALGIWFSGVPCPPEVLIGVPEPP